jgi:hypothetical protein
VAVKGGGDNGDPPVKERLKVGGTETVTQPLEVVGTVTGSKPVGQLGACDPDPAGLTFGPLVPVDPHLGRIREVAADLDEPGTPIRVGHVEDDMREDPLGSAVGTVWR